MVEADGRRPAVLAGLTVLMSVNAGAVHHRHRGIMHHEQTPGRGQGLHQLLDGPGDVRDGGEGRHRKDHRQDQLGPRDVALGHQPDAHGQHGQPAQRGHALDETDLKRPLLKEPKLEVGEPPTICHHLSGAGRSLAKGGYLPHSLDAVHHMSVYLTQLAAQFVPQSLGPLLGHERADGNGQQEWRKHQRDGPSDECQRGKHARRHQDGDEGRRYSVGKEELHQFDVSADNAHQVSRAAAHHVGRGQRVQLFIEVHPHLGQQPVGQVMGHP